MDRGTIARYINIVLGIWVMAAPAVLGYGGAAATNDRIVGPLVITFATVAIWEATRQLRRANIVCGAWLLVAPWLLGFPTVATLNSTLVGAAVMGLALIQGEITGRYGGGWSRLWTTPAEGDELSAR